MLYGAHVSIGGGIAEAIPRAQGDRLRRGADLHAERAPVEADAARPGRPRGVRAARRRRRASGPPSATRSTSSTWRRSTRRSTGSRVAALTDTVRIAAAIGADVCFHVGSHRGQGLAAAMPRILRGLEAGVRGAGRRPLAAARELRRRRRHDRSRRHRAGRRDRRRRPPAARALPRHLPHLRVRRRPARAGCGRRAWWRRSTTRVGLDRLRALHVNDAAAPLGSNRDRHANMGAGELGRELGVFLSHPALQGLPAILETPAGGRRPRPRRAAQAAAAPPRRRAGTPARGASWR